MEAGQSSTKTQLDKYPPTKYVVLGYIRKYIVTLNNNIPSDIELLLILYYDESISLEIIKYYQKYQNIHLYKQILINIRTSLLLHGCPDQDLISESISNHNDEKDDTIRGKLLSIVGNEISKTRKNDDTTRGKLWRLVLGVGNIDANNYQHLINKKQSKHYVVIRNDTKRTFLTSKQYQSRVSQERLSRVLNAYCHKYNTKYVQVFDCVAALFLYAMPELHAFATFCVFINNHIPTYFCDDYENVLCGMYAASYLSWDILKVFDKQLFDHLSLLPPHCYLAPVNQSLQCISQPFDELQKLWDFLLCFGVHLCPIVTAAQVIVNKTLILKQNAAKLLQGILSQRKWMNHSINANNIINCSMNIICILKQNKYKTLWQQILNHSTDIDIAMQIKHDHEH
eukprot:102940_1